VADDREVARSGATYTFDTIEELGHECVLLLGADAVRGEPTWNRSNELLGRVTFAVVDRPGVSRNEIDASVLSKCVWIDMPRIDISSTAIRSHVASGFSARFLVPDAVAAYIETNDLYKTAPS
jgi:nicotinate-nucleotide adenylyltransferase